VNKQANDQAEQQLLERSRQALDQSLEDMDAATLSRLNQIRQAALAPGASRNWQWWIPASGLATACAIMVAVNFSLRDPVTPATVTSPLSDLDLLASNEDLEMLEELEFYAWLETELEG
jgi:hypothetical protein